jgi:hypothetical protein
MILVYKVKHLQDELDTLFDGHDSYFTILDIRASLVA